MAGYNYERGMSNNAISAYEDGLKPLSKFSSKDFKNLNITSKFAKFLAENDYWEYSEWHHSGKFYSKVKFYSLEKLYNLLQDKKKIEKLKSEFEIFENKVEEEVKVSGQYAVFNGKKFSHYQDFEGVLKGNWIHLANGKRKKAASKYVTYNTIH